MTLKVGTRLFAQNSTCEVIVVRGSEDPALLCGGLEMVTEPAAAGSPATDGPPLSLGKRYAYPGSGVEVLCVKAGPGPLAVGDHELTLLSAKPLPASD